MEESHEVHLSRSVWRRSILRTADPNEEYTAI
jgi:hypothetical protein